MTPSSWSGSASSSNAASLVAAASEAGAPRAILVANAAELPHDLDGIVAVTAAASTPEHLVDAVVERLRGAARVEVVAGPAERTGRFPVPAAVRRMVEARTADGTLHPDLAALAADPSTTAEDLLAVAEAAPTRPGAGVSTGTGTGRARRVVVVGAGLAGLSAACELLGRGHEVTVVERGTVPGGRAGVLERDGFRFDTGPTVLTMPDVLAATFAAAGSDMDDLLTLRRLDPLYRATFADGSTIRVRSGRDAMADELRDTCGPGSAAAFDRYAAWVSRLYELEMPNFIARDFDGALDLVRQVRPLLGLARLGGFGNLDRAVRRHFADGRLQRLFSFQAMYAGLAPQRALALYAVISYMDVVAGVFYPEGGLHSVATALAVAVEKAGGEIRYGAPVDRIVLTAGTTGAVRAVRLVGGEHLPADAVVATPDLPAVYRTLLPGLEPPRVVRRGRYSPSAVLRLAGVRGVPGPDVEHHNLHFGAAWRSSFQESRRGASDGRPVHPRDRPHRRRPGSGTAGLLGRLRARAGAKPGRNRGLARGACRRGRAPGAARRRPRLPRRRGGGGGRRSSGLGTGGARAGHAVLAQPPVPAVRTVPTGEHRGDVPPASCSPARAPAPAWACPSSCCRAGSRPNGCRRCREPSRTHRARGGVPPLQADQPVPRHYLLLVDPGAAARQAAPRVRRLRVLPARRRHRRRPRRHGVTGRAGRCARGPRRAVLRGSRHGTVGHELLAATVDTVLRWDIDPDCFRRFLRSMAMDLTVDRYETWDDLGVYMDGSAAVIGEMMLPVLQPIDSAATGPARSLGVAFQLTNFLRDVAEDLDRGRVYLPQEDLRRFGADPAARAVTPAWVALMEFEIARARALYTEADEGIALLPDRSARCIAAARRLYSGILDRIEDAGFDVFSVRAPCPSRRRSGWPPWR